MRLAEVLDSHVAAMRRKHGFVAVVRREVIGYSVSLAKDGYAPHYEEAYESLDDVVSLFAESCVWHPSDGKMRLSALPSGLLIAEQQRVDKSHTERFWAKVKKTETCWLWTGNRNTSSGYGMARMGNGRVLAHRVSWELTYGITLDSKEYVLHLTVEEGCGELLCVNPAHLYVSLERGCKHAPAKRPNSEPAA